jgi:hypothetical protein
MMSASEHRKIAQTSPTLIGSIISLPYDRFHIDKCIKNYAIRKDLAQFCIIAFIGVSDVFDYYSD